MEINFGAARPAHPAPRHPAIRLVRRGGAARPAPASNRPSGRAHPRTMPQPEPREHTAPTQVVRATPPLGRPYSRARPARGSTRCAIAPDRAPTAPAVIRLGSAGPDWHVEQRGRVQALPRSVQR